MRLLHLIIIMLGLFRETRHQIPFLFPSIPIFLATEEFIEPEPSTTPTPVVVTEKHIGQSSTEPPITKMTNPVEENVDPRSLNGESVEKLLNVKPVDVDSMIFSQSPESLQEEENALNSSSTILTNGSQFLPEMETKGEEEEPIPSYMEWAQKKQQELKNLASTGQHNGANGAGLNFPSNGGGTANQINIGGGNGGPGTRNGSASRDRDSVDAKNFASPDCGAKVVQSNSEAQNPSGVLSSSHDEYMLNKCGTSIWFVVELCEPLTMERISLGNLELFSSSPKDVELGISDRYPTRDWVKLGPFTLPDARAIHPILLPSSNSSTFGKFVKVSILSHYGSEHYCPVSIIKVNGKSEYEVLESETTHQEDQNKEESALYEEQLEDQQNEIESQTGTRSVGGIKDAVLNMLNKAVQTIVRRGSSSESIEKGETFHSLKSECRSVLQCVSKVSEGDEDPQEIYKLLSCNSSKLLPFLQANSPWCGWDYCHAIFARQSIGLPWQPEGFFAAVFGGPSVLQALCHFNKPLKVEGCDATAFTVPVNNNMSAIVNNSGSLVQAGNENSVVHGDGLASDIGSGTEHTSVSDVNSIAQDGEGQITPPNIQESSKSLLESQNVDSQTSPTQETVTEISADQQIETLGVPPLQNTVPSPPSSSSPPSIPPSAQTSGQETQIPSPNVDSEGSSGHHQFQPISGSPPGQKESVFVRLTNRIKSLERNQSLTASYLEELSRRFKKQNEDNSILADQSKKIMNDTRIKLLLVDDYYRMEVLSIRRNLEDVRERLFTVQLQRGLLVIICFIQSLLLLLGFIWAKRRFAQVEVKIQLQQHLIEEKEIEPLKIPKKEKVDDYDISWKPLMIRKRSNSDVTMNEKAKKLRKRNRKQVNLNGNSDKKSFDIPKSSSGDGLFKVPVPIQSQPQVLQPKENIDPQFKTPPSQLQSDSNDNSNCRPNSLLTKVDSPFMFVSKLTSNPEFSNSGRFALLASPARPDSPLRSSVINSSSFSSNLSSTTTSTSSNPNSATLGINKNRSGSGTSTTSTLSDKSLIVKGSLNGFATNSNSKGSSDVGGNSVTTAKKGKKVGLKAFMPKIFDR